MGKILFAKQNAVHVLKFVGDVRVKLGPVLTNFVSSIQKSKDLKSIVIDLTETLNIDSTSLGLLAKISLRSQETLKVKPTIVSNSENINRILDSMGFDQVFVIVKEAYSDCGKLRELPPEIVSETALREQVLEAHKVLMGLNGRNRCAFHDLVAALEEEHRNMQKADNIRKAG